MNKYKITEYSFNKAKKLNLIIKPSSNKNKKIDVFDMNNNFLAEIGDINYKDYPNYLELESKGIIKPGTAKEKRRLYKIRHEKHRHIKNSKSYFADNILW